MYVGDNGNLGLITGGTSIVHEKGNGKYCYIYCYDIQKNCRVSNKLIKRLDFPLKFELISIQNTQMCYQLRQTVKAP